MRRIIINGKLDLVAELKDGPFDGTQVVGNFGDIIRMPSRLPLACEIISDYQPLLKPNYNIHRYKKVTAETYEYEGKE